MSFAGKSRYGIAKHDSGRTDELIFFTVRFLDLGIIKHGCKRAAKMTACGKAERKYSFGINAELVCVLSYVYHCRAGIEKLLREMVTGLSDSVIKNEGVIALCHEVERYRLSLSLGAYGSISAAGNNEHSIFPYGAIV